MKIALICTEKLPVPPVAGGAIQLYIDGILPYLSIRHDITVFSVEHPGLASEEIKDGVRYIRVPASSKNKYVKNIRRKLSEGYDLVHVFNRPLWILPLSESLPDVKFSLSLHNEMFHPEKISAVEAESCIERVEFINTVSRFIADGVSKQYPSADSKLHVVYSGVDIDKYKTSWSEDGMRNKEALKSKYNLEGYKVVLSVGRLSIKKGIHVLMNSMKEVMEKDDKTALVIIGSKWYGGNEEDDYVKSLQVLAKSLKGPIIFTGFLTPAEIPAYYNLGDLFVCASQWNEPLARVHYEAMAAGLPIITTCRGGNAEVVAGYGNGIVIDDYKNPDAFTQSIRYLLDNPAAALEFGKLGRQLAEEKYNWARVASEIFEKLDK